MQTSQLESILRSDPNVKPAFCGVYPSDQLPLACNDCFMVVNLDPHDKPGSHWVALHIKDRVGQYFDSYGLPPLNNKILNFINSNCRDWEYNANGFQNDKSKVCGEYCTWYISEKARGKSMEQIQKQFCKSTVKNDQFVAKQVANRYGDVTAYKAASYSTTCQCCAAKST
jgi:hypothetical protein